MDGLASSGIFLFDDFRLDRRAGGLFRRDKGGAIVPVAIGSRALDVLGVLVARAGDLVSKDEIFVVVWPGTVVEEGNLAVQISALRRVLDQGRAEGSCIQTIAGRGYRFVTAVIGRDPLAGPGAATPPQGGAFPPPRLSVVVLPFTNLSNDLDQQYFADGITEDLTVDLSRIEGSFVISRNTAFTYGSKPVDTKQIGRELGVRYVLEGSVRRSGNQVRVNAQLIDAETDAHLWAERFDRDASDLFALQDEITSRIAVTLNLELVRAEAARPTDNPNALDYIFRGRAAGWKPPSRDRNAEVMGFYERALALDPHSVEAQSYLAIALAGRVLTQMTDSVAADIARAEGLSEHALAASPLSLLPHMAKGEVLRAQRRSAEAIPEYETVLALNRNSARALSALGQCKLFTGSMEETIPLEEQAIRLSPRDPNLGVWYVQIGWVHLLQSRTDEAIVWFEKARSAMPAHPVPHAQLASAYALNGETERAAAELAEARGLRGDGRYTNIARLQAAGNWGVPKIRALFEATYFAGLRKAGMPAE